jgi:hypothetical protein
VQIASGIRRHGELACNSLPENKTRGILHNSRAAMEANQVRAEVNKASPLAWRCGLHTPYIYVGLRYIAIVKIDDRRRPIFSRGISLESGAEGGLLVHAESEAGSGADFLHFDFLETEVRKAGGCKRAGTAFLLLFLTIDFRRAAAWVIISARFDAE